MNNSGVNACGTPVADLSTEVWDRAIRTNLYAYFFCARRFGQLRLAPGSGGTQCVLRACGQPQRRRTGLRRLERAIRMLTRTLALELAPHKINVNSTAPGMVPTPFSQPAIDDPALLEEQVQSISWDRAAKPEEIAKLADFLAAADADYVTGASYVMDGGLMINLGQGA